MQILTRGFKLFDMWTHNNYALCNLTHITCCNLGFIPWNDWKVVTNWNGCEKGRSGLMLGIISKFEFGICVEGLRKFMKSVRNDIVIPAEIKTGRLPYT
jgi:hypothetical protein